MIYQACVSHDTCCYCRYNLCTNHICISLHHTSLSLHKGSWLVIQVGVPLAWADLDLKLLYHMAKSEHTQTPQLSVEIARCYILQYSLWQCGFWTISKTKEEACFMPSLVLLFRSRLNIRLCNMEKDNQMMKCVLKM